MRNVSIVNGGAMNLHYEDETVKLWHGDSIEVMRTLPDSSVDSVVCDPPYGLANATTQKFQDALAKWVHGDREYVPSGRGFMGKDWDSFVPPPAVWDECLRVLKPGGHMAVFAGARTQDLMGLSIRLAGFEIRDTLGWIYGSGFPKSMDVSKAIDKAAGVEFSASPAGGVGFMNSSEDGWNMTHNRLTRSGESTDAAKQWSGWGTALKPAIEPIILARKPLDGTVAANVLAHGVGGLNIDACRVATDEDTRRNAVGGDNGLNGESTFRERRVEDQVRQSGRFPANVLLDEHAAAEMDEQSGWSKSPTTTGRGAGGQHGITSPRGAQGAVPAPGDSGGASRFFPVFKYQAKAPKKERPVIVREDGTKIAHPTVKPLELMSWLVTLITPEGGTTLDPFAGSGATLQAAINKGFHVIGIERDSDYCELIEERLKGV